MPLPDFQNVLGPLVASPSVPCPVSSSCHSLSSSTPPLGWLEAAQEGPPSPVSCATAVFWPPSSLCSFCRLPLLATPLEAGQRGLGSVNQGLLWPVWGGRCPVPRASQPPLLASPGLLLASQRGGGALPARQPARGQSARQDRSAWPSALEEPLRGTL